MLQTTTKDFFRCLDSYGQILGKLLILIQNPLFIIQTNQSSTFVKMCIAVITLLMGNQTDHQKCPESEHYNNKAYRIIRNIQSTHCILFCILLLSQVYSITLHILGHCSM